MRVLKRGRMEPVLGVERNHLRFHCFGIFPFKFSYFLSGGSKGEKEEVKQGGESRGRWSVSDAEAQHEKAQGFL